MVAEGHLTAEAADLHRRPSPDPHRDQPGEPGDAGLLRGGGEAGALRRPAARRHARGAAEPGVPRRAADLHHPRSHGRRRWPRPRATTCSPRSRRRARPPGSCRSHRTTLTGKPRNATGAVVSVEPGTGAVRAMVGGAGFESEKFNVTTQGVGRSGGSTFKVFVLMALLENGYLPTDSVSGSSPCTFRDIPGHVPGPVPGRELRRQRWGRRHDHVADAALVELRLRAPRADRRHPQGGAAGAPDGDHHPARRGGVDAARHQGGAADRHGRRGRIDRRRRHVAPPVLHRPGRGSRRSGAHRARGRSAPGGVGAVGAPGLRGPREERPERHRHPSPHPEPARRRQDRHRAERERRLVRRASRPTSPPRCGSARPTTTTPWRSSAPGITGGSYPAEIWGRYMRAWHEGLEEAECGEPRAANRSSRYLSLDRDNDSGGGGGSRSSTSTSQDPSTTASTTPPGQEPRRPPQRRHAAGRRPPPTRAGAGATVAPTAAPTTDPRFGGAPVRCEDGAP